METTAVQSQSATHTTPRPSANTRLDKILYRTDSLTYDYKSKDGDTVHLEYKSTVLAASSDSATQTSAKKPYLMSPDEAERFRSGLNDALMAYKEQLIKSISDPNGVLKTGDGNDAELAALEASIPEYWNADNTSQRIVDFATSFLSSFTGENSDFFKRIKDAIEEGFKQAKDMLGELPGAVGKLVNKTYELTMDKLDKIERDLAAGGKQENAQAAQESFRAVA
ncbi:MAG: DUF5610 domain-containing protein [Fibrobacterota bacterium]